MLSRPATAHPPAGHSQVLDKASQKLVGRKASIRVHDEVLTGIVTFVSPEVNSVRPEVRVFVEFENQDKSVLPGMTGSLEITSVTRR